MKSRLMTRATYVFGLLALALLTVNLGCSSSPKKVAVAEPQWETLTRKPASNAQDGVTSALIKETISVESSSQVVGKGIKAKACGYLVQGESAHTALNNEDAGYFIRVDCTTVSMATGKATWLSFANGAIKKGQKGTLTRWRRQAVLDNMTTGKARKAVPYVCFHGQVTEMLCSSSKTSTALSVSNFTSKVDVYKKW